MRAMLSGTGSTVAAVAAAGLVAAGLVSYGAPPASAAACSGATGVTVVVDFNELGGGVTAGCDRDGAGRPASQVFTGAGYPLTYTQEDPGFVCRVSGKPAADPCARTPPATAYWALWWSDGESGSWVYSSSGVTSLEVPDGGYVAFAWHQGDGRATPPDAVPTAHEDPAPTTPPSGTGGGGNGGGGGGHGGGSGGDDGGGGDLSPSASATPSPSAGEDAVPSTSGSASAAPEDKRKRPDRDREERRRDRATTTETATPSDAVPDAADISAGPPSGDALTEPASTDDSAVPTWIGLGVAAFVLAAAGVVTVLRRRTG